MYHLRIIFFILLIIGLVSSSYSQSIKYELSILSESKPLIELDKDEILSIEKEINIKPLNNTTEEKSEHKNLLLEKVYLNREGIYAVSFSHNKKVLAIASSNFLRIYQNNNFQLELIKCINFTYSVKCLIFHPTENYLAYGRDDGEVGLIDLNSMDTATMAKHQGSVNSISFSTNGRYILSGGEDQNVILWDLASNEAKLLYSHNNSVKSVSIVGKGRYSVSCSNDGLVIIYDIKEREIFRYSPADFDFNKSNKVIADYFHPWLTSVVLDKTLPVTFSDVLASGWERKVVSWDPTDPNTNEKIKVVTLNAQVSGLSFLPNINLLSAIDLKGCIYLIRYPELKVLETFKIDDLPINYVELVQLEDKHNYLVIASSTGKLFFFKLG